MSEIHPLEEFDNPNFPTVYLSDREYQKGRELARQIADKYSYWNSGLYGYARGRDDTYNKGETGILGELAVAKYYDFEVDGLIPDSGDGGYDFYVRNTTSGVQGALDVKTITFSGGGLIIDPDRYVADAFILVERRIQNFGLVGIINSEDVKEFSRRGDKFPNNPYFVPPEELQPVPNPDILMELPNFTK